MNHPTTDAETIWREHAAQRAPGDARPGTLDDPLDEEEEAAIADEIARADDEATDRGRMMDGMTKNDRASQERINLLIMQLFALGSQLAQTTDELAAVAITDQTVRIVAAYREREITLAMEEASRDH